jgi:hypothetical protein
VSSEEKNSHIPPLGLARAAAELAELGYYVFPLVPRTKRPITETGFKAATRDARQIADWWRRSPAANIGIACGASAIVVLDIDTKAGAEPREILSRYDRAGAPVVGTGLAPERNERHPRSLTGRRGVQVYFRGEMPSAARLVIDGVEIKGVGGYVVAPPSVHPCGVEYVGQLPPVADLPPIPVWLPALVRRPERRPFPIAAREPDPSRVLAGLVRVVREAGVGNRNHATFWAVHRAADHASAGTLDGHHALGAIRDAALATGLEEIEVDRTIRSALAQRTRAAA